MKVKQCIRTLQSASNALRESTKDLKGRDLSREVANGLSRTKKFGAVNMDANEVKSHLANIGAVLKVHEGELENMGKDFSNSWKTLRYLRKYFWQDKAMQGKIDKIASQIENIDLGYKQAQILARIFDAVFYDIHPKVKDYYDTKED